jgi:hypothetical protein
MAIKHFDHSHQTVAEVRECSGLTAVDAQDAAKPAASRMTPKQPTTKAEKAIGSRNRHVVGIGQAFAMGAQSAASPESEVERYQRQQASLAAGERAAKSWGTASRSPRLQRVATDPMVRYVKNLAGYKEMSEETSAEALRYVEAHESGEAPMSFQFARQFIESYKNVPQKVTRRASEPKRITQDGMYRDPATDKIYKVQFPREAIGDVSRLYAKLLVVVSDAERDADGAITKPAEVRFDFVSGLVKEIRPEWRMTLAEAQKFGKLYGVCCDCGRVLTHEQSKAAGVGPKCGEDGRWAAAKATITVR